MSYETAIGRRAVAMLTHEQEIYEQHVLRHYEEPYRRGRLANATHVQRQDSPLCGDVVLVELRITPEGRIVEACFDGQGCCVSQAAASMLVERIEGRMVDEVQRFQAEDMLALFGARLTPLRQRCCLLAWRAAQQALASFGRPAET